MLNGALSWDTMRNWWQPPVLLFFFSFFFKNSNKTQAAQKATGSHISAVISSAAQHKANAEEDSN